LIEKGHTFDAIKGYSLEQIKFFAVGHQRLERYSRAARIDDGAVAAQGTDASIKKAVRKLSQ
jgi:hypothetical protein